MYSHLERSQNQVRATTDGYFMFYLKTTRVSKLLIKHMYVY